MLQFKKVSEQQISLIGITFLYLIIIHIFIVALYLSGNLYLQDSTYKEILLGMWGYAWDGMHYLKIATEGYKFPLQAFFPFYPLVIATTNFLLPLTFSHRINLVLIFVAVLLMDKLLKINDISRGKRRISIVLFLCLPTGFFLIANYNETIYIILASLILIGLQRGKMFYASILGALLSATKITGVIMPIVFLHELISSKNYSVNNILKYVAYSIISISGTLLYFIFLNYQFGTWTIFLRAQKEWNRSIAPSQNLIFDFINKYLYPSHNEIFRIYLELGVFIFLIISLIYLFRSMPRQIWIYSLMHVLIPLSTGSLLSLPRLSLLAFPIYLWIFTKVNVRVGVFLGVFLLSIQLFSLFLFYNNVFIG